MMNIRRLLRNCQSFFLSVICDKLRRTNANDAEPSVKHWELVHSKKPKLPQLYSCRYISKQNDLVVLTETQSLTPEQPLEGKNSPFTEGNLEVQIQINGANLQKFCEP